jgi:hypothetical protein
MRSRMSIWAGHVARIGAVRKNGRRRRRGRVRHRWEDDVRMWAVYTWPMPDLCEQGDELSGSMRVIIVFIISGYEESR